MIAMLLVKKFLKNNRKGGLLNADRNADRDIDGFTLLEVVIAMAIMVIAFSAILAVEGGSINASTRAKQMNIVGMLAKNKMVETEFKFEGKEFTEVKKEEAGTFEEPYQDYQWKAVIKELKFPNLAAIGGGANAGGGGAGGANTGGTGSGSSTGQGQGADMVTRLVTNFLSKAIRQVIVTVSWKKGTATQDFSLSTYWVNLNYEFQLSEQ